MGSKEKVLWDPQWEKSIRRRQLEQEGPWGSISDLQTYGSPSPSCAPGRHRESMATQTYPWQTSLIKGHPPLPGHRHH